MADDTKGKAKQIKLTPENALGFIDGVIAKFQGTRDDHRVLDAALQMLGGIVREHRERAAEIAKLQARVADLEHRLAEHEPAQAGDQADASPDRLSEGDRSNGARKPFAVVVDTDC